MSRERIRRIAPPSFFEPPRRERVRRTTTGERHALANPITRFRGDYDFLSNFYMRPFYWRGYRIESAEHAYQSEKTTSEIWRWKIIRAPTASLAKKLGRAAPIREDWERVKDAIMLAVLRAKFEDRELLDRLRATGRRYLEEGNTWRDNYWGVCPPRDDGSNAIPSYGRNTLGKLLMQVRDENTWEPPR
jgi:ribA/ribD-fused uncharacterized protein